MNWDNYLQGALEAVKEGSKILKAHVLDGFELKPDKSPVTKADKLVEEAIRNIILTKFPECGFIGEEFLPVKPEASLIWYCDPIDGTWSYLNQEKTSSITLSLFAEDTPKVSIIYNAFTDELYTALPDQPATVNKVIIPRVEITSMEYAVLNFHISANYSGLIRQIYDWWSEEKFSKVISQGGSIAYAFARVAEGIHHICLSKGNKNSKMWDLGPGIHMIEQAGGRVTNLQGEKFYECKKGQIIVAASNHKVHGEILELLNH